MHFLRSNSAEPAHLFANRDALFAHIVTSSVPGSGCTQMLGMCWAHHVLRVRHTWLSRRQVFAPALGCHLQNRGRGVASRPAGQGKVVPAAAAAEERNSGRMLQGKLARGCDNTVALEARGALRLRQVYASFVLCRRPEFAWRVRKTSPADSLARVCWGALPKTRIR